jgi:hypothetical protein
MRFAAVAVAFALLGADPNPSSDVRYFLGSWKCAGVPMTFAPLTDGSPWTRLSYGVAPANGTAILGYVTSLGGWIFRDFHADGAYADMSSPGPSDGRWQWTGPYYPQEGGPPLGGRVTYSEVSPTRFDRVFEVMRDDNFVPTGNDSCMKVNP